MIRILFLAVLVFSSMLAHGNEYDVFARDILKVIASNDLAAFKRKIITVAEVRLMAGGVIKYNKKLTDRERFLMEQIRTDPWFATAIVGYHGLVESYFQVRKFGKIFGIDWDDTTYIKVTETANKISEGTRTANLKISFISNHRHYSIAIDKAVKMDRGWVILGKITIQKPGTPNYREFNL